MFFLWSSLLWFLAHIACGAAGVFVVVPLVTWLSTRADP
jgi:hypothetical protein